MNLFFFKGAKELGWARTGTSLFCSKPFPRHIRAGKNFPPGGRHRQQCARPAPGPSLPRAANAPGIAGAHGLGRESFLRWVAPAPPSCCVLAPGSARGFNTAQAHKAPKHCQHTQALCSSPACCLALFRVHIGPTFIIPSKILPLLLTYGPVSKCYLAQAMAIHWSTTQRKESDTSCISITKVQKLCGAQPRISPIWAFLWV